MQIEELWENHEFGESEALRLSDNKTINGVKMFLR